MHRWRLGSALVAVGALAGLSIIGLVESGPVSAPTTTTSPATTTTKVATTTLAPVPPAPSRPAATVPALPSVAGPEEAVEAALAAWGRFAVSGNLSELERWFDPAGPQHRLLAEEAPDLAAQPLGHPPYRVTLGERSVAVEGDEATVSGQVLFVRTGEPSQRFTWTMELRRSPEGWRLWTVSDG